MIPKIIHYCWFGGNPIPEKDKKCIDSWKKFCPDYEIIEWNENNFDVNCCQYVKEAYEAKKWAFVSDYVRLKVIFENGGIYFDTDVELIKNIDNMLNFESFFCFENHNQINTGLGFGAHKKNIIVKKMLDDYNIIHFKLNNESFDLTPCPVRNTNSIKSIGLIFNNSYQIIDNNVFLSTEYMCPIDYFTGKINITDNTISIHWYNGSWQTEEQKKWHNASAKLSKFFGNEISDVILGIYFSIKKEGLFQYLKKGFNLER